ncbi:hypothetical protein APR04_000319 [Promicromonospora umidemergens]|uniref:Uncharacterized protein n=1 Tax=Promicromonospora umidemergens TaxID=629679 RepID=A0ABP8X7M3_9MICO|nr:hypothetical protein [Promicromonospora umidemergens]MCP2281430.1 hypothetical protein [Promicromonospora umidemergens]
MPRHVLVRPRLLAPVAATLGVALALGSGLPAAQAADPLPGIEGEGAPRDPYQIDSADDLRTVAGAINGDPGAYGGRPTG